MLLKNDFHSSISENLINIDEKIRSNLFTWRGQFSPQLVEQILIHYASEEDIILDPFMGSGTVLYECSMLNLPVIGCEINLAACSFSRIYELSNINKKEIELNLLEVDNYLNFLLKELDLKKFENTLINFYKEIQNKPIKSTIILAFIVGLDFEAKKLTFNRIKKVWESLKNIINNLNYTDKNIYALQTDARNTGLEDNSIDFIITSPPYINVFNYHQNYRKSLEKVGVNVLEIAKSEIGANRKFRQNRFLTVVQYCMDIGQVFIELDRVCKKNSKIVFIVGKESNVKKTLFLNSKLIKEIASIAGYEYIGEQRRVFKNKFGNNIYEDILRFKNKKYKNLDLIEKFRKIGINALINSLNYCSSDVKNEIEEAITKSENINFSHILERTKNGITETTL
ncbi:DNA methyltransferase [Aliarcobacter cibarius]|uniref:site-specific DNA-methyltransferase (cytosine-N(4)-specific) n=1 Tax=Aliarcobacter cibarius TaxID=255507 RepID=A0ABY2V2Q8_9BACT|nr:DNA methyltransferase [Aliarcobacter cibarius]TLS96826.1 site-specific DNA-methyltransferase [Aliarcobacter cibarius]TLS97331.1 site-specific DNA-methyltransferase [Aliarcobacter cibarius]